MTRKMFLLPGSGHAKQLSHSESISPPSHKTRAIQFDAYSVPGFKDGGTYYRALASVDVERVHNVVKVIQVLDGALRCTAARVVIDGQARAATPVGSFLAGLKTRPHLHFA